MRAKDSVVARGVVSAAEIIAPGVGERIAVQRVIRVVDGSRIDLGVLKVGAGERVAIGDAEGELGRAKVARAVGVGRLTRERPRGKSRRRRVLHSVVGTEEPDPVLPEVAAEVGAEVLSLESFEGSSRRNDRLG